MCFFRTGDRSKSNERNFRKSCDLSSYQMSQYQNLAVFGVRHDLFNNHVRFEMSQKPTTSRPRATSSDFFVQQKSKILEEKSRERSTSRKGTRVRDGVCLHCLIIDEVGKWPSYECVHSIPIYLCTQAYLSLNR